MHSQKVGRVRTCTIDSGALSMAEQWINERRIGWERRFDRLGAIPGRDRAKAREEG